MTTPHPGGADLRAGGLSELSCLRSWAVPLLRCPACRQTGLKGRNSVVECPTCAAQFRTLKGVMDLLVDPHPIVARERAAMTRLDGQDAAVAKRLGERLRHLDTGSLVEADLVEFPCLRHASESLAQIRDVLKQAPLVPGEVIVELGADHCWASSLFLDAGCRVIALDITDHLGLAPRRDDPNLCRIIADMNDIPVSDGRADVVWTTAAAHHSWSLKRTFAEAARVLRPGGRLYFCCEPLPSWLRYPFGRDFGHAERDLGINETWLPRRTWLREAARARFVPRVVLPIMDRNDIEERLRSRRLPARLAPVAFPFLRVLQVSVHLLATKAGGGSFLPAQPR